MVFILLEFLFVKVENLGEDFPTADSENHSLESMHVGGINGACNIRQLDFVLGLRGRGRIILRVSFCAFKVSINVLL